MGSIPDRVANFYFPPFQKRVGALPEIWGYCEAGGRSISFAESLTEGNAVAAPRSSYPKAISGERQLPFPLEYAVVATVAGNYVKRSVGARYFRRSADCEYSLIFGTGSGNGSVTVPNYSTVGSAFHVVVASYDTVNGIKTIQVYN